MKKTFFKILKILISIYIILCVFLYFFQEKLIFFPQKQNKDYQFNFEQKFEEFNVQAIDGTVLNGILFKSDSSKGLIFYLHGNGGSNSSWGSVAKTYTDLNYDVFILDYRGYGKSEGSIKSQEQFFTDIQSAYDVLKKNYSEDKIVVLGYSIGTGPASKLASENHPKLLVLQAPYYSLTDVMNYNYHIIPAFVLKYKFETNEYLKKCKMPVIIFHGNRDEVVYYGSSLKLRENFKPTDKLITLEGRGHNGMTDNPEYRTEIQKVLNGE